MKKITDFDVLANYMLMSVPEEHVDSFKFYFNSTIKDMAYIFDSPVFSRKLEEDTYVIDYVFPTLKRVLSFFYIKDIPIFAENPFRRKLFKASFDLKEFLEKCEKNLTLYIDVFKFENLDNISEILKLTVDDYVAFKISKTVVKNQKKVFRETIIKKIIN